MTPSSLKLDLHQTPRVAQLQSLFEERHRLSSGLIGRAVASFGTKWAIDFEQALGSLFTDAGLLEAAAKGYASFAFDSMRRQKAFEVAREYPHKTYAQAAGEVYFNERHMKEEYLPGLLLSHYLWPHHYRQLQFFDTAFVGAMGVSPENHFAEVGVGTAVYSHRILTKLPTSTGAAFDISPSSCRFAEDQVRAAGAQARYTMHRQDIIAQPITPVPWLVCVEVLEHLEHPVEFLGPCGPALRLAERRSSPRRSTPLTRITSTSTAAARRSGNTCTPPGSTWSSSLSRLPMPHRARTRPFRWLPPSSSTEAA